MFNYIHYAVAFAAFLVHSGDWLPTYETSAFDLEHYVTLAEAIPPSVLAATDPNITPSLLMGLAYVESRYTPEAEGRVLPRFREQCLADKDAYCPRPLGVVQVTPSRFTSMPAELFTEPAFGFLAGVETLRHMKKHMGAKFLCHYGGGPHCAQRYADKVMRVTHVIEQTTEYILKEQVCIDPFEHEEHDG